VTARSIPSRWARSQNRAPNEKFYALRFGIRHGRLARNYAAGVGR
jgi:hypothetical protein